MPDFTPDDFDISPGDFVDACNSREIKELIDVLIEDGHIEPDRVSLAETKGIHKPNTNDYVYLESLQQLTKCRDLLTIEEEEMIVKLADRFKYIR